MSTAIGSGASKELRHAYDRVNFFFWTMSATTTTWQRGGGKRGDFDAKKVASLFIVDVAVNAQREETEETEEDDETPGLANSSEDAARCRRSARLLFDIFFSGESATPFLDKKDIFHLKKHRYSSRDREREKQQQRTMRVEQHHHHHRDNDHRYYHWLVASYLAFFLLLLFRYVVPNRNKMVAVKKVFAVRHRLTGVAHMLTLAFGGALLFQKDDRYYSRGEVTVIAYDVVLALMGILTTASAISDFGKLHMRVREGGGEGGKGEQRRRQQQASGVLHETKTVATSEMKEHLFYQALNLVQILYLHFCDACADVNVRVLALVATTWSAWRYRAQFPVNSFSQNYSGGENGRWFDSLENALYRAKKWQYVFYKTCLLHGLNMTSAIWGRSTDLSVATGGKRFQLYWCCLNASYVMEFFLQTLVKKKYAAQSNVLLMNQFLMVVSSLSAIPVVLSRIHPIAFLAALALNFLNRKKETTNVCLALAACMAFDRFIVR